MELRAGQRITAPFLPAPAEVKKFEPRAGYFLLEVVLDDGHHTYKPLRITDDQLTQIQVLGGSRVAFLVVEHRRTTSALIEANERLANAVEEQGRVLDGVRALLASQGYTLPPLADTQ